MAAKLSSSGGGKGQVEANSDINVTPFVDVMLVLLIIFMVAIPMATTAIKVDLPPAIATPPDPTVKPTIISLGTEGKIYLLSDNVPTQTSLSNLRNDLIARGLTPDKSVMVRADGDVLYEDFMGTLNQLQTDGYFKVGLMSEDTSMMN